MTKKKKTRVKKTGKGKKQTNRPRISLCMIVKNEEKFLEGCLESVKGIVDEMIIVDTGSDDGTLEIAGQYGARVFHFKWVNDFSAARNEGLKNASGEWILYLDADERLVHPVKHELKKIFKRSDAGAFFVSVFGDQQYKNGKQQLSMSYPRIFKNDPRIRFEGKVHEQIATSIARIGLPTLWSDIKIHHLGYDQSWDIIEQKCRRNADLLKQQVEERPEDFYARFQLGNTLSMIGDVEESNKTLKDMLLMKGITDSIYASAYNLLGANYINNGDYEMGIEYCAESLKYADYQVMARWFLSNTFIKRENFISASEHLEEIDKILSGRYIPENKRMPAYDLQLDKQSVLNTLAKCYLKLNDTEKASETFKKSLSGGVTEEAMEGFLNVHNVIGISADTELFIKELTLKNPDDGTLLLALGRLYKNAQNHVKANEYFERCSSLNPDDPSLYETMIEIRLNESNFTGARELLQRAEQKGVNTFKIQKYSAQIALNQKDVHSAFEQLKKMRNAIPPDRLDLLERIDSLEKRLAGG